MAIKANHAHGPSGDELLAFDIDRDGRLDASERALQRRVELLETGRMLNDRYVLVGLLGSGGQAETFLALDVQDDRRQVAVKMLRIEIASDWKSVELFQREAEILQRLNHPQIPAYVDHFHVADDGVVRFVSVQRFVHGEDLGYRLARGKRWSADEAHRRIRELMGMLEYIHGQSPPVVHRDIKPSNIILGEDDLLYLVDFGAAQDIVPATAGGSTIIGTTGYVPMEQYMGQAMPASDIYALGATALHMVTGTHPADFPVARSTPQFAGTITDGDLSKLLASMLAAHAEDRPRSVGERTMPAARENALARRAQFAGTIADDDLAKLLGSKPAARENALERRPLESIGYFDRARPWLKIARSDAGLRRQVGALEVLSTADRVSFATDWLGVPRFLVVVALITALFTLSGGLLGLLKGVFIGGGFALLTAAITQFRFRMDSRRLVARWRVVPLAHVVAFEPVGRSQLSVRLKHGELIPIEVGRVRSDARDYLIAVLNHALEKLTNDERPNDEVW